MPMKTKDASIKPNQFKTLASNAYWFTYQNLKSCKQNEKTKLIASKNQESDVLCFMLKYLYNGMKVSSKFSCHFSTFSCIVFCQKEKRRPP